MRYTKRVNEFINGKIHIGIKEYYLRCGNCRTEFIDYHYHLKEFIVSLRSSKWKKIGEFWICPECSLKEIKL